jgi:hypothetical protein
MVDGHRQALAPQVAGELLERVLRIVPLALRRALRVAWTRRRHSWRSPSRTSRRCPRPAGTAWRWPSQPCGSAMPGGA